MSYFKDQIEKEKAKISRFKEGIERFEAGISNCNQRIKNWEALDKSDQLDAMVSSMIGEIPQILIDESETVRKPGKKISDKTVAILKYFGSGGHFIKDAVTYSKDNNIGLDENNIRNLAMNYTKKFGYLESPSRGFYRLTELGQNSIK